MKYIILFLFLLAVVPLSANNKDKSFVVVIDPGHGGKDPGAVGKKSKEKDINLAVSLLVGQYIRETCPNVEVVYTRKTDTFVGLIDRSAVANKAKADLFISIHTNSTDKSKSSVRGAEVFTFGYTESKENLDVARRENSVIVLEDNYEQKYADFNADSPETIIMFQIMREKYEEQSVDFATSVQKELIVTARRGDRGVKQANLSVLRKSSMPRVLIELDFISNVEAENYMASSKGQKEMARGICNAFAKYKRDYDRKNNITLSQTNGNASSGAGTSASQTLSGKVYKVQILTSGEKLSEKSSKLKGYQVDCYLENNIYKYTYGATSDWDEICRIRKSVQKDFKDAFIVTFENGVRVPNS